MLGAALTPPTDAARGPPTDDHPVVRANVLDSLADGLDDTGAFVAEQHRERMVVAGSHDVEVGMADAGGLDPDTSLAGAGLVQLDLLDAEVLELVENYAAIHEPVEVTGLAPADERKSDVGVGHQVPDHGFHAFLAADREAVGVRPAEQDGVGAEGQRLQHVRAAPDAAVHQHHGVGPDRLPDLHECIQRRDGAVDLAAAVVGDHDPVDAALARPLRVLGGEHALDEERQLGQAPQPGEVVPGQTQVREGREHRHGSREHIVLRRLFQPAPEDRVREELRAALAGHEREVCLAQVTVAPAEDQRVECDDERPVACRLGPLHDAGHDVAIVDPVELEPPRRVAHRLGDLLDRVRGSAREHHRNAGRRGGTCDGELAVRVRDRQHADRREQERRRRACSQHLHGDIALAVSGQHPGTEPPALERFQVGPHRRLRAGPARDVVERAGLQGLGCARLPLLRRDRPRGLAGNVDRVLYLAAFEVHASYDPLACRRWKGKWRS